MFKSDQQPDTPLVDQASYWNRSQQPLQALFFLLPLIGLYELGLWLYGTDEIRGVSRDIHARSLLFQFFDWFGINGYYLPGLIVVTVLLSWHWVRNDPWRVERRLYGWMWLESLAWAVPLFVFALMMFRAAQPFQALEAVEQVAGDGTGYSGELGWRAQLVFSIGAGIYEELLFRLIGIALVHLVFVDLLSVEPIVGAAVAIALTSLAFAVYHFSKQNPFQVSKCLFYTGAGVYFAGVYLLRGFGIAVGTHAAYDIMVVVL